MNRTIAGVKGAIHIPLTDEEIAERARLEEESHVPETKEQIIDRKIHEKWPTDTDMLHDILDRGVAAVKRDKQTIIDEVNAL